MDSETVFTWIQQHMEKVRDYFSVMQKHAKRIPGVDEDLLKGIIIRGLQPHIKASVLQHQAPQIHRRHPRSSKNRGDGDRYNRDAWRYVSSHGRD